MDAAGCWRIDSWPHVVNFPSFDHLRRCRLQRSLSLDAERLLGWDDWSGRCVGVNVAAECSLLENAMVPISVIGNPMARNQPRITHEIIKRTSGLGGYWRGSSEGIGSGRDRHAVPSRPDDTLDRG